MMAAFRKKEDASHQIAARFGKALFARS